MLHKTNFSVPLDLLNESSKLLYDFTDFKTALNQPTGDFFYDAWEIKDQVKGTVFEKVLSILPKPIGEARIIKLDSGSCYLQHADIDDRYHLNLSGKNSYLIDTDNQQLHELCNDGYWYEMDAGRLHTAVNIGYDTRYQIVVRKLLTRCNLTDYKDVTIEPDCEKPRFQFDNFISPWLNYANKKMIIESFEVFETGVKFRLDSNALDELEQFDKDLFLIRTE